MLNRDSSVKTTALLSNRSLTYAGDKGTQTTGRRANSPPSCSLRDTVWRDIGLPAAAESCEPAVALLVSSGVWHIATGSDRLPLWRFSGVQTQVFYRRFDPFGNGSTAYGCTTMHTQLSGNSRSSFTSLQHTDSPPTHLGVQMVSSTHAFRLGYLGFRGTIAACELKNRSSKPLLWRCSVTTGLLIWLPICIRRCNLYLICKSCVLIHRFACVPRLFVYVAYFWAGV
ncbi:hypothetical protein AVEN_212311-1 [Araneus ventricosus]|uniref:Uncharacterized protein n=1 Tax=Araneus ventricosus TaxID=182803 RepID=A0A4Y2T277_ARAVE|nr:hypothetical protein AVEN_212311-1 [Araneus ventricosus]